MSRLFECGVICNDDAEFTKLYCKYNEDGSKDLYYRNDSYGIENIYGFKDVAIKECGSVYNSSVLQALIKLHVGNTVSGAICTEKGILFIIDKETGVLKFLDNQTGKMVDYTGKVDFEGVESDCDDYDDLVELFEFE